MVTRNYKCNVCHHTFEISKSIKEPIYEPCQACGQATEVIIDGGICFSVDNVTTVGQLAERNVAKIGKYKIQELERDRPKFKRNEQQNKIEKILAGGPDRVNRYIQTGK